MLISVWNIHIISSSTAHTSETVAIGLSTFEKTFQNITPFFLLFLLARFVSGLGGSGYSVIGAYIADISEPGTRTRNMGYMGATFGLAFLIGPTISGLLSSFGMSLHNIIILTVILITINVILIWTVLQEPVRGKITEKLESKPFHFTRPVIILLILSLGFTFAFAPIQSMSAQYYSDKFQFSAAQIGYTMAVV